MAALRAGNLALKFGVELAAVAALAYWGASLGGALLSVVMAVLAPAAMIALWGRFAAPRASRRLSRRARIPFELTILLLAAVALLAAGEDALAAVLAAAVVLNALLLTAFGQWEA
ncbi:MAG TPA: DUF2568 domain-containing protein [Solirubrobacteraceae bacterium]|nr:DUF2568 domain-containing protein [Solirubrobacteraceae bacterium]